MKFTLKATCHECGMSIELPTPTASCPDVFNWMVEHTKDMCPHKAHWQLSANFSVSVQPQ